MSKVGRNEPCPKSSKPSKILRRVFLSGWVIDAIDELESKSCGVPTPIVFRKSPIIGARLSSSNRRPIRSPQLNRCLLPRSFAGSIRERGIGDLLKRIAILDSLLSPDLRARLTRHEFHQTIPCVIFKGRSLLVGILTSPSTAPKSHVQRNLWLKTAGRQLEKVRPRRSREEGCRP